MKRLLGLALCWLASLLGTWAVAAPVAAAPAVAFFYGANPPWDELQAFDIVVVDPDHVPDPRLPALAHTRIAAYVALGEVQPSKPYAGHIPAAWLRGENKDWGSRLIDQSQALWPQFFADQVIAPLWANGYRTVFLDTLDSYHHFAKTPEARALQEAGMVAVIRLVKQRYPQLKLIFNRGFEILGQTHELVEAVAAESLFQGYDAGKLSFASVSEADRRWLLGQLNRVRDDYKLPVIAIDYVPASQRDLARATAQRIMDLGFTPWVATPDLGSIGVGSVEVMPRKILVVHSAVKDEFAMRFVGAVRLAAMPLNYMGYAAEYVDPDHLPEFPLNGRYAGILIWLTEVADADENAKLVTWLDKQVKDAVPVSVLSSMNFLLDSPLGKTLGLSASYPPMDLSPIEIIQQDAMMGFERPPRPELDSFHGLSIAQGQPLLTLKRGDDVQVAAAITPWGGYVIDPYAVLTLPGGNVERWVIDPFRFFRQSLRLPVMPVPDVTTETGRRMLMVHMDGDGFVSRTEQPGNPMAGEVVRDRVVNKYPVPMTISVIEGEISPQGLYPALSGVAESAAQDIFRAPHVALASHSYSHPFNWGKAEGGGEGSEDYHLPLPGYAFDLQREIEGSIRYIESRLAPPGKKVEMFFWTGNCIPGSAALEWTRKMGVLNMNGGDTVATRAQPTMTRVEGLGLAYAGGFQVFAPNQNENVYTNLWRGPFYGFEKVIETFEFTETPRRLKPINIYFHTYLVSKRAGLQSLDKIFAYALAQETTPVFVADYARKVLDFQHLAVARTSQGWRIRGAPDLRTLRLPTSLGLPDMEASQAVAGFRADAADTYVHLSGDQAQLVLRSTATVHAVLVSANAKVARFERIRNGFRWDLKGNVPLRFTLANVDSCRVRVGSRDLVPTSRVGHLSHYELKDHAARPLEAICGQ